MFNFETIIVLSEKKYSSIFCYAVVGDYINTIKTTFHLNFYFYQAFERHGYTKTWKQRETVN